MSQSQLQSVPGLGGVDADLGTIHLTDIGKAEGGGGCAGKEGGRGRRKDKKFWGGAVSDGNIGPTCSPPLCGGGGRAPGGAARPPVWRAAPRDGHKDSPARNRFRAPSRGRPL